MYEPYIVVIIFIDYYYAICVEVLSACVYPCNVMHKAHTHIIANLLGTRQLMV